MIDSGKDELTPDQDETLLRILAEEIRASHAPTPGEILETVKGSEPESFKTWTARGISAHLKRYGLATNKTSGRRVYGRVTLDDLRLIQEHYGVDLGFDGKPDGT